MSVIRLFFCVAGIYASYLLWGIAQERLATPFPKYPPHHPTSAHEADHTSHDRFPSSAFMTLGQAIASCICALVYLTIDSRRDSTAGGGGFAEIVGWKMMSRKTLQPQQVMKGAKNGNAINGTGNGTVEEEYTTPALSGKVQVEQTEPWSRSLLGLLLRTALCQTLASPFGFMSLRYISYPTMVLAKSCKLIPVLLLNVILYRRKFKPYKYAVVALVSIGISMFMAFGKSSKKKGGGGSNSSFGLGLLFINLILDGLTASTQDELFSLHPKFTGRQLMFNMSLFSLLLSLPVLFVPPAWPSTIIHFLSKALALPELLSLTGVPPHMQNMPSEPVFFQCLHFLSTHPSAIGPLVQFALLGGLGQLFIFETISHFGSLTLVMVTVTRKLFTMLLSVFIFGHRLGLGQWAGIGVVFGGIGLEAAMKRREIMNKRILEEKRRSQLKKL